ncbi:hypothetical protein GCM10027048_38540 [Hymenobacter coalescens]
MNVPSDWQQLLRVALLGTRQSGEPVPALAELPGAAGAPREAQVLATAGALGLVRKAGYAAPTTGSAGPEPAPAETQPALSQPGQDALRQLLDGSYVDVLPDFLAQVAWHGRRVPHRQLIALLDYVEGRPELRDSAAAVLGERGRWLARQNPAWAPLLAAARDEASWETGKPAQRRDYLRALHRQDPTRARAMLAATLPQESAKQQAELLSTLTDHLEAADAPLLEPLLASKSKDVRQQAASLLVRTPGNALVERLWQRAQAYLRRSGAPAASPRLEVTLPEAWDPAWLTEGIEPKDARFAGEKAAWLGQLLALIPPARWSAHLGMPPAQLLALAADREWAALLLTAWRHALLLHPDPEWARAYLSLQLEQEAVPPLPLSELHQLLPLAELQQLVLAQLPAQPRLTQPEPRWLPLLLNLPGPWSAALTTQALRLIDNTLAVPIGAARNAVHYRLGQLLSHMQQAVAPEQYAACAEALNPLRETETSLNYAINNLLDTLYFRRQLAATFTEPPGLDS